MALKRECITNVLVGIILVASMSGCGVPSQMDVAISNNGIETNIVMREDEVADNHIRKDVLLVVFDGLASKAMQRYAEKLRDNYVADGFDGICIKYADNHGRARAEAIKANAQGRVICLMSYSNSDSVLGAGGRNAFAAWTEEQGLPVIEIRADDTWGGANGGHVESNVTSILNIRTNTLGHRGPKMTSAALECPDTLYWDMCAPVHHIAIFGDKEYWHIPQVVCVINGDDPFASVSSDTIAFDDPAEESRQDGSGASVHSDYTPTFSVEILEEEAALRRNYTSRHALAREKAAARRTETSNAKKALLQGRS
ncbi:MAG: hypothetical protein HN350_00110 [Phycisphaerales bacterium]|nr:hypothetical protein [Phycisphaerales bacterium]